MTEGISVGSVSVSVVPEATRFVTELRGQIVPEADRLGKDVAARIASPISDGIVKAVADGGAKARTVAASGGNASGGAFADTFRARVTSALRDLPTPKVGVDATEADAELADIRARLAALGDVRVGVDIATADAVTELDHLKDRIDELGARSPDIAVRVDAAKASADLAAVRAEVNALDGSTAHVNVEADTATAAAGLSGMLTSVLALGPALVPIGAAATAGIGGVAAAAASGAAGLGVLALGFSAVSGAVDLLGKEHTAAAQSAARNAAATGTAAAAQVSAANQVRSAEEALANTRANAANQAITSAEAVKNARRSLADTERTAAQQEITASQAVVQAQYARTQADQQEANAQKQLNNAREQAARDLESAANRAIDSQLAAKQAAIDVTNAQQTYNTVMKTSASTQLQRQQATLDLAKAQQALIEANEQVTQSAQDNAAAQKAGVNGAPAVVSATQAIAAAQHQAQQATAAVTAARAAQVTQAQQSAETIAKAEQALTDAERAQAQQRRQSAFSVEQAQQAVTNAQLAQAKASQGAGASGSTALQLIQAQLAKTNPAVLAFATFITGTVEPAFGRLKTAAAAGLLPGVETALKTMEPLFQPLVSFVSGLATTIGDLFVAASKALTAPFWVGFFNYVSQTAGPTLTTMSLIIGHIITGFAGLMQAFGPVVTQMGSGLDRLAGHFASFGKAASDNAGFQGFLRYVEKVGPQVVDTIGHVVVAVGHIVEALAPIGPVVLSGIKLFADIIEAIPVPVLTAIAVAVIGIVGALKAWAIVQAVLNGLMLIWDTLTSPWLILMAGAALTILAVVAAVALLAVGIYELVKHWTAVWHAIKVAAEAVYNWIKDNWPYLLGILIGPFGLAVAVIVKHWSTVKAGASAAVSWVTGKFDALLGFFTKMGGRIAKATVGMWDGIKTAFRAVIDTLIGWWDSFVSYLKIPAYKIDTHIPGVGKIGFDGIDIGSHLRIPYLASGGVAQAATLGVFGEAGREAILPLTDPNAMRQIADAIGAHGGKQPLIGELNIHNPAPEPSSRSLPKTLRRVEFELSLA